MTFSATSRVKTGHERAFRMVTWGTMSLAIGIFMPVAWRSHSDWLGVTAPEVFYMKYSTSLVFIAGGIGLWPCG
jgi:hypothetical protein